MSQDIAITVDQVAALTESKRTCEIIIRATKTINGTDYSILYTRETVQITTHQSGQKDIDRIGDPRSIQVPFAQVMAFAGGGIPAAQAIGFIIALGDSLEA